LTGLDVALPMAPDVAAIVDSRAQGAGRNGKTDEQPTSKR
jgi:hypothetical protein